MLVEERLPEVLKEFINNPVLFADLVTEIFLTLNNYLDEDISQMISDLRRVLGFTDHPDALVEILLVYPNRLAIPSTSTLQRMAHFVGKQVSVRLQHDTKLLDEVRPSLLVCWEEVQRGVQWEETMSEVYTVLYMLKFKAVRYTFDMRQRWGHSYRFVTPSSRLLQPRGLLTSVKVESDYKRSAHT